MSQACSRSPFSFQDESEKPWLLWEAKNAVTALSEQKETDSRYEMIDDITPSDVTYYDAPAITTEKPIIQRKQYNAVLSRMNQAVCKTGTFSSWQP